MKKNTYKYFGWVMTLCMVATLLPVPAMAAYSDTKEHWAEKAIQKWSDLHIVQGSDDQFRPDDAITRGEMAVIIDRMMKYETKSFNTFSDLGQAFYTDAILKANASGVIKGDENKVRPMDQITREEAAVMIGRAFQIDEATTTKVAFSDESDISGWASGYINALCNLGYVHGFEGKFNPKAFITRAEVITIFDNSTKLVNEEKEYTGDFSGTVIVNTPNAFLENMEIKGDLIITEGVGKGDATLNNVKVLGKLIVQGGGENSIHIKGNSQVENLIIEKAANGAVRIVTSENAVVYSTIIQDGKDDVILTGSFENVTIAADIAINIVDACINKVEVTTEKSIVNLDGSTLITELIISETASGTEVNNKGSIEKADIRSNGIILDGNKPNTIIVGENVIQNPVDNNGNSINSEPSSPIGGGGSIVINIPVTAITVTAADNKTQLIKDNTLQFFASVMPENASNKMITWSVVNGTGSATIDSSTGLLTATSTGTVTVNATNEASKVVGVKEILIVEAPTTEDFIAWKTEPITAVAAGAGDNNPYQLMQVNYSRLQDVESTMLTVTDKTSGEVYLTTAGNTTANADAMFQWSYRNLSALAADESNLDALERTNDTLLSAGTVVVIKIAAVKDGATYFIEREYEITAEDVSAATYVEA